MRYANTIDSVSEMAKAFRVQVFEKEHAEAKGMVIAIGSGLMMATMDALKTCKVAVEYGKAERNNPYFADFFALATEWADYVCVHAWFSITKPANLINLLSYLPGEKVYWKSNENLYIGKKFNEFVEMVDYLNSREKWERKNLLKPDEPCNLLGNYD